MADLTLEGLATLFFNHRHSGTHPDARKIPQLVGTTVFIDDSKAFLILISPNGTKYRLGVDDDGALKTTRI